MIKIPAILYQYVIISCSFYDIPRLEKVTSAVRKASVSRHNRGKIIVSLEPPSTIVLCWSEGFQESPVLRQVSRTATRLMLVSIPVVHLYRPDNPGECVWGIFGLRDLDFGIFYGRTLIRQLFYW